MEFESAMQRKVYERVGAYMRDLFGVLVEASTESPLFWLERGSARVWVSVGAWAEDDALVGVRSIVVRGARVDQALLRYLLTENWTMRFGAFSLDSDDDIWFEHNIVGSTLDPEELKSSVLAVLGTADRFDDEIVKRWGGHRSIES